jgi:hypothetical protein
MKAITRILAHDPVTGEERWFEEDEEIPVEFESWITNPDAIEGESLKTEANTPGVELAPTVEVSSTDPRFPEYGRLKSVDAVLSWVDGGGDDQLARAEYAHEQETASGARPSLLRGLEDRLTTLRNGG